MSVFFLYGSLLWRPCTCGSHIFFRGVWSADSLQSLRGPSGIPWWPCSSPGQDRLGAFFVLRRPVGRADFLVFLPFPRSRVSHAPQSRPFALPCPCPLLPVRGGIPSTSHTLLCLGFGSQRTRVTRLSVLLSLDT